MSKALPVLCVVLLAGFAAAWWTFGARRPGVEDILPERGPRVGIRAGVRPVIEVRVEDPVEGTDLAAPIPEILYAVVDGADGRAVPGARILRARDGAVLGITDYEGRARVRGTAFDALVFAAGGYLLEHFFDRPAAARQLAARLESDGYVEVPLHADVLTVPVSFEFLAADGSSAESVEFQIASVTDSEPDGRAVPDVMSGPAAIPPELQSAWRRHAQLAAIVNPDFGADLTYFGRQSRATVYEAQRSAVVRFVTAGQYRLRARAGVESCAREFAVGSLRGEPVRVQLRGGLLLSGRVVDAASALPIPGAVVLLRRGTDTIASTPTDPDGGFSVGPVETPATVLELRHPAYAPVDRPAIAPGRGEVFQMSALADNLVRGVVRRRPDLAPVAGARVSVAGDEAPAAQAVTDSSGRFEVRTHLIEPTVSIRAEGFLDYAEMINANGETILYDLVPAAIEQRRKAGLSAVVRGFVRDSEGRPQPGIPVRLIPQEPARPTRFDGRRTIRGGRVPFLQMAVTDPAGRYELEWPHAEPVRVVAVRGGLREDEGRFFTTVLGSVHDLDLRVAAR